MALKLRKSRSRLFRIHYSPQSVRGSAGFTIIELVMVIILLAILVVSAAPKFLQSGGFSLEGGAAMIVADMRYAKEMAMATHVGRSVGFTLGGSLYTVDGSTVSLPAGVVITSPNITFTFNPLGEPTAGGGGSVSISAGGDTRTINVENFTGMVSVL